MVGEGAGRDMVTVTEAARELKLSGRAVLHRIERGELQAERISSRLYLIPRAELERHKEIGRLKPGRKRRDETATEERQRENAEHLEQLDEDRRRIRGET